MPEDVYAPTHYAPGWVEASDARSRARRRTVVVSVVAGVLVAVAAAGTLGAQALTASRSRPLPADVTAPTRAYAVQLVTGSCLADLPPDGDVDRVDVVPCADPHAAQVVAQYAFDPAAVWPGQPDAHRRVARACVLSDAEVAAGVRVVTWAPSQESWARGDRDGLCLAVPPQPVTGSFVDGTATPVG